MARKKNQVTNRGNIVILKKTVCNNHNIKPFKTRAGERKKERKRKTNKETEI